MEVSGDGQQSFEVIVIDDDSEDGTGIEIIKYTSAHSNIRYYKNDVNSGFSISCNYGARQAKGEFLVFLNNDTRVGSGWLQQLTETIRKDRNIWAVGAKCIYPDQTIQHAGVAFPDFYQYNLYHIYKDAPAFFPLSDYEKDFKCITAACFIIRKCDFEFLNGFDERYRNGFEDVDLCLRISQSGKRIVYQPRCEIIHYESKSEGRFDSSTENKKILLERWMTSIQPDETAHFRQDLAYAIEHSNLKEIVDYSADFKRSMINMIGKYEFTEPNEIIFSPSKSPNMIKLSGLKPDAGQYLLVAGEINAKAPGKLRLKYMTGQEKYYSDQKSLTKKILPGRNIFHFSLLSAHLSGELMLEFSSFKEDICLQKLGLYSFPGSPGQNQPSVAILCCLDANPSFFPALIRTLTEEANLSFPVKLLVVIEDLNKLGNIPEVNSGYLNLTIQECPFKDLTAVFNQFIENSGCEYVISINDSVSLSGNDIVRFVELMETDPGIGVIYNDSQGFFPFSDSLSSPERSNKSFSLDKVKDLPIAFRSLAWLDAERYDIRFSYFFNLDLCLAILSGGNWNGYKLEGIRAMAFINQAAYPAGIKVCLEDMRTLIYSKHGRFIINQLVFQKTPVIKTKPVRSSNQTVETSFNPHSTLSGSLKAHFNHFIIRSGNRIVFLSAKVFGPKLKAKVIPHHRKVVYTIILGDYDDLKEPEFVSEGWDYVCFTNNKHLRSKVWRIVQVKCPAGYSHKLCTSLLITNPFSYLKGYQLSVLVGGQISIHCDIEEFVNKVLPEDKSIALMNHPYRDCTYDEAKKVIELKKADKEIVKKQIRHYMNEGLPAHTGMVQTGITICRLNDARLQKHCRFWMQQVIRFSQRDQLSFNYLLWKYKLIEPAYFEPDVLNSEFRLHKHKNR